MVYELKEIVQSCKFNRITDCLLTLAQYTSIVLSVDKGIPNEIRKVNENKYLVITDTGKAWELKY